MKPSFTKVISIIIILFSGFLAGYAEETLQYELTLEKVKGARIFEFEGVYYVSLQLKETYKQEFAELTGNNIGRRLEIIFSGQIFASAIIQVRIPSGTIRLSRKWSSKKDAKRFIEALKKDNDDIKIIADNDKQDEEISAAVVEKWKEELAKDKDIAWYKVFGGKMSDGAYSLQQTSEGGYIIAGHTKSFGAGSNDFYLIKTDSSGNEEWSRAYGGDMYDVAHSVQQTTDGGYIIAGVTETVKGSDMDCYLVKTDSSGNEEWSKTFGGKGLDQAFSVKQTSDGGYIVAGSTNISLEGDSDVYLIKTDSSGNEEWSRKFGGKKSDVGASVQQTPDGEYIIAGLTESYGSGLSDIYLIKANSLGNEEWSKTIGSAKRDGAFSIQKTSDGGYIIAGSTESYGSGLSDIYLIKMDSSFKELWSKTYGSDLHDLPISVQQTTDGGYIIAGSTLVSPKDSDIYLVKTDASGNEVWTKIIGGDMWDSAGFAQQTADGGYIIAGTTQSYGLDSYDVLLLKLLPRIDRKREHR